jgi:hypothetical protein
VNRAVQHTGNLHRLVAALVEGRDQRDAGQRTNLVTDRCTAIEKEPFELFQISRLDWIEEAEAKGLRTWRRRPIEHGVCAGFFDPRRPAIGKNLRSGFDEARIAFRLGSFQASGQFQIRKGIE